MKNKYQKPLLFFAMLLYPVFVIPWIVKFILRRELFGYFLFSLLMAYLAYIFIPYDTMDIVRYYEKFEVLKNISFEEIIVVFPSIFKYFFNIYIWIIAHLNLKKEFIPFSITFLSYYIYFLSFDKVIKLNKSKLFKRNIFIIISSSFILVSVIRFFYVASGLRNDIAFVLFIYALTVFIINRNTFLFVILSIFAIFIHISILPLFLLFTISFFISKKLLKIIFIISFFLLIFGLMGKIFYFFIDYLAPFLKSQGLYFHAYFDPDGKWGSSFWETRNLKTIIYEKYLKPMPFYLFGFYLMFFKRNEFKYIIKFLYLLFIFIAVVSISRTLFDRYAYFFVLLFTIFYLQEIYFTKISKYKKYFLILIIFSFFSLNIGGFVKYRNIFVSKNWIQSFYIPAPFMMLEDIQKQDYIKRKSL